MTQPLAEAKVPLAQPWGGEKSVLQRQGLHPAFVDGNAGIQNHEGGRHHKSLWVSPGSEGTAHFPEPPTWGDIAKPGGINPGPRPRAMPPFSGLGGFYAVRKPGARRPRLYDFTASRLAMPAPIRASWLFSKHNKKKEHVPARTASSRSIFHHPTPALSQREREPDPPLSRTLYRSFNGIGLKAESSAHAAA